MQPSHYLSLPARPPCHGTGMTACSAGQRHLRRRPGGGPAPLPATVACFLLLLAATAAAASNPPPAGTFFCGKKSRKATITSSSYKVEEKTRTVAADGSITYCCDTTPNAACGDATAGCCPRSGGPKASRLLVPLDVADCITVPDTKAGYMQAFKALKQIRATVGAKAGKVSIKYSLKDEEVALSISLAALPPTGTSAFCITLPPAVISLGCPNLWRICGDAPCPFAVETKSFVNSAGAKGACCVNGTTSFLAEMPSCEEVLKKGRWKPCRNEGKCTNNAPGVGGYTCECRLGWAGDYCDEITPENKCVTLLEPCTAVPGIKGMCINDASLRSNYTCNCTGTLHNGQGCSTHYLACFALGDECLPYGGPGLPSAGGCPVDRPKVERGKCVSSCSIQSTLQDDGLCRCARYELLVKGACVNASVYSSMECPDEGDPENRPTAANHCTFNGLIYYDNYFDYYRVANASMAFVGGVFAPQEGDGEEMRMTALWVADARNIWDGAPSFFLRARKDAVTGRVTYAIGLASYRTSVGTGVVWLDAAGLFGDANPARALNPAGMAATARFFAAQLARAAGAPGADADHPCNGTANCAMRACFALMKCMGDSGVSASNAAAAWAHLLAGGFGASAKQVPPFGSVTPPSSSGGGVQCVKAAVASLTVACAVQPSHKNYDFWSDDKCYSEACDKWYTPWSCTLVTDPTPDNEFCCKALEGTCCHPKKPGAVATDPCPAGQTCNKYAQRCVPASNVPCANSACTGYATPPYGSCSEVGYDSNLFGYNCTCGRTAPVRTVRCIEDNFSTLRDEWWKTSGDPTMTTAEYLEYVKYSYAQFCTPVTNVGTTFLPRLCPDPWPW
jgi:hypothetical protein